MSSSQVDGIELMKEDSPLGRLASMFIWVAPNPEKVVFHLLEGVEKVLVEIYLPPDDRGRVIGKEGSTIRSIRTIFFSSLTPDDLEFDISLLEEGGTRRRQRTV